MRKVVLLFSLVLCITVLNGCGKKDTWQGMYYDNGLYDGGEIYGPVFNNYEGCKDWALSKINDYDDYALCSKNCHSSLGDTPVCEDAVRSWKPFPHSETFDTYKE